MLLTRESEDQLADLAGNAMSSTVVGTCMLSALVVGSSTLKPGPSLDATQSENDGPKVSTIIGEDQLKERPFDLVTCNDTALIELVADAGNSARLCVCEGRRDIKTWEIQICRDCGFTSCQTCGKRPEHNYELQKLSRLNPDAFERKLTDALLMRLHFNGVSKELLEAVVATLQEDIDKKA